MTYASPAESVFRGSLGHPGGVSCGCDSSMRSSIEEVRDGAAGSVDDARQRSFPSRCTHGGSPFLKGTASRRRKRCGQVLNRAVAWGLIDYNPAKRGVPNPPRRHKEKRPFESWEQIEAVAERLGPVYGPMVVFAAATGLRPSELFALEQRDLDRAAGVVYVRRAYANGRLKKTKTRLSTRAVPLQAIALEALDRLPASENPILFPNSRGGHIDFRSFGRRHWKPAQVAAGIEPLRHLYDPRHTYATFALRAGVSVFAVSRFMGSSIAMIDRYTATSPATAANTRVSLLDALAIERTVDAGWTPPEKPANPLSNSVPRPRRTRSCHAVDARWTSRPELVAHLATGSS